MEGEIREDSALADRTSFQMVSLLKLAQVTEQGVRFSSPHDGSPMLLTPEHSISLQNSIGSDIIMQLDDVIATTSPDRDRMLEAMERSIRWLDRCIAAHAKPASQNLFCIIQGGLDLPMRQRCCDEMVQRNTPGIAIGGLSGGEDKSSYCKVLVQFSASFNLSLSFFFLCVDGECQLRYWLIPGS